MDTRGGYCLIGAGAAGLAVCRALRQQGVDFECLEREDDIGGIFHYGKPQSSIYKSTHLLSSKATSEFPDFPMPREFPQCPHHSQVLDYFRAYARHFGLYEHIQFQTTVRSVQPQAGDAPGWRIQLSDGQQRSYAGLIIANGHHWDPQLPNFPGQFNGRTLHSKEYKTPELFAGQRVLIVGAGNTACDIACDAVPGAARVLLSMRRPVHILPKYTFGETGDGLMQWMSRLRIPMWFQRTLAAWGAYAVHGRPQALGLPVPDHRIFDAHVTVNSFVPFHVRQGDIAIKPNVACLAADHVQFVDGSREAVDLIVYATGYKVSFPFIDHAHLNWQSGGPQLFLNQFHPQRDDLAVVGLFQSATGGHWPLMHFQAQLLARFLSAQQQRRPVDWFQELKRQPTPDLRGGFGQLETERQRLTVEPVRFQRYLNRLMQRFDRQGQLRIQTPPTPCDQTLPRAA